jgi:AraC-like DNA-binding protein
LHVYDLIALAIGATRDGAELAGNRGLRAARLDAVKKHTLAHLGDPSFSVNDAARCQAISSRYVQKLFENEGTTFSSFLLSSRLALAHRRLVESTPQSPAIGAIAADCGFGDLSYFNQCFRRTYGETPTDVRNRARRRLSD